MSEVVSSEFNLDPHPNKTGHEKIKTRILEQLTIIEKEEAASSNNNNNNNDNNNNEDNTVQRIDISKMTISDISDQIYTGSEIKPSVTIKNGNNVLKENQDYTLIYHNNINVGEAKVMITGIGNYQGTAEKTFNIKEQSRSLTDISTCTLEEIGSYTYTGIEITPMIVIKDGETELVYETDFDVKYQDNINAGTAKVIIEGIGNYKGSKESTFVIDKKSIEECDGLKIEDQVYTGNPITPEIVLKLGSTWRRL